MLSLYSESDTYSEVAVNKSDIHLRIWISWHTMVINRYAIIGNVIKDFLELEK